MAEKDAKSYLSCTSQGIQRCAIAAISVRYGRVPRACVGCCLAQAQYIHCAELSYQTVNANAKRVSAHIQRYYPLVRVQLVRNSKHALNVFAFPLSNFGWQILERRVVLYEYSRY